MTPEKLGHLLGIIFAACITLLIGGAAIMFTIKTLVTLASWLLF